MKFTQHISDRDYKKAIAIHYFAYKYTYLAPVIGALAVLCLSVTWILFPETVYNSLLLMLAALYLTARPLLYVLNVFNSIKSGKVYANETDVKIDADSIVSTSHGNISSINLADLHSYNNSENFLFLYMARNHFLLLDKREMIDVDVKRLMHKLDALNIKRR